MEKVVSFSEMCFIGRRESLVTGTFVVKSCFTRHLGHPWFILALSS